MVRFLLSLLVVFAGVLVLSDVAFAAAQEGVITPLSLDEAPECRLEGDPLLFGVASFFVPGLGQFFNGQDGKGLLHIAVALGLPIAVYAAGIILVRIVPEIAGLLFVSSPLLYLGWGAWSGMDAYNVSSEYCTA